MRKFIPCEKCHNGWLINEQQEEIKKCECLETYQHNIYLEFLLKDAHLPIPIKNYSLDSYIGNDKNKNIAKIKKYVNEFKEKFSNIHLYFYGANSTQKTTVASWIAKEVIKQNVQVKYILMNELIKMLTSEGYEETSEQKIEKLYNVDLLIIDESFDKKKLTLYKSGFQLPFIDEFLRNRLEKFRKATIFISNVSIQNIHDDFGQSLKKLVERNCSNTNLEFIDNVNTQNNFNTQDLWE